MIASLVSMFGDERAGEALPVRGSLLRDGCSDSLSVVFELASSPFRFGAADAVSGAGSYEY